MSTLLRHSFVKQWSWASGYLSRPPYAGVRCTLLNRILQAHRANCGQPLRLGPTKAWSVHYGPSYTTKGRGVRSQIGRRPPQQRERKGPFGSLRGRARGTKVCFEAGGLVCGGSSGFGALLPWAVWRVKEGSSNMVNCVDVGPKWSEALAWWALCILKQSQLINLLVSSTFGLLEIIRLASGDSIGPRKAFWRLREFDLPKKE